MIYVDIFFFKLLYSPSIQRGPLAQLVEQRPFKAWVTGSNPVRLRKLFYEKFFGV